MTNEIRSLKKILEIIESIDATHAEKRGMVKLALCVIEDILDLVEKSPDTSTQTNPNAQYAELPF